MLESTWIDSLFVINRSFRWLAIVALCTSSSKQTTRKEDTEELWSQNSKFKFNWIQIPVICNSVCRTIPFSRGGPSPIRMELWRDESKGWRMSQYWVVIRGKPLWKIKWENKRYQHINYIGDNITKKFEIGTRITNATLLTFSTIIDVFASNKPLVSDCMMYVYEWLKKVSKLVTIKNCFKFYFTDSELCFFYCPGRPLY